MIELIKKWFKRPVVINFTVESLNSGNGLNIIHADTYITPEVAKATCEAWLKFSGSKVLILDSRMKLEQLTDADLRKLGLIRADFGGDDES